jgi:hypothetical protein
MFSRTFSSFRQGGNNDKRLLAKTCVLHVDTVDGRCTLLRHVSPKIVHPGVVSEHMARFHALFSGQAHDEQR